MKRIAFVLAATVLGSGCFVSSSNDTNSDVGSVNIYWDFIRTAPAQPSGFLKYDGGDTAAQDGACSESGVDLVTVDSPLGPVTVDCVYGGVEGVGLDGVVAGTQPFRIRGWRGDFAVYDETFNLVVSRNATTNHFVDVHGVSAPLDVFAYLAFGTPPNVTDYLICGDAIPQGSTVPPNIDLEIRDVVSGALVLHDLVGCGRPVDPLPAPAFAGDLDLDNYDVRLRGLRAEDDAVVFDSCRVRLDHFVSQIGQDGFAATLLTQPVPTCAP